jgi:hypothetical protein
MNRSGKITICLLGGLVLTAGVRAQDAALTGDPYAVVVARNIFGLNPPPPPNANPQDANPPPKITPNGIMTIFGQLQVLFKVAGTPKPGGAPPADEPYILSEGQRQDDIEVMKIDEKNSIVTFNNHGETQTLPLVTTLPSSTPSPAPAGPGGGGSGGRFSPGFVNPGGGPGTRPRGGGGGNGGGGATTGGPNNGANFGNVPTPNPAVAQHPSIDPATQTIMIEANRFQAQQQGDPTAKIFPITELTPPSDSGSGSQ